MATWAGIDCVQKVTSSTGGPPIEVPTIKCFEAIFARILTVFVSLAALALFVMLVIGGIRFLTSAGDQKATTSAKQTMTYAMLGLGLMVLAYLIFRIIEAFTGVHVLRFFIPT